MKNRKENKNIKEIVSSKKQIVNKSMNSLQDKPENSEFNSSWVKPNRLNYPTWFLEKKLLNLYLHKKYKSKQVSNQAEEESLQSLKNKPINKDFLRQSFGNSPESLAIKNFLDNPIIEKSSASKNELKKAFQAENLAELNSVESRNLDQDTNPLFESKSETSKLAKTDNFTHFLFYYKQIAVNFFKQLSIRPTQLTIILSSIFYFIAICATLERRENNRYLSILLQGKIPGYANLYQNGYWESFENLTSKYKRSGISSEGFHRIPEGFHRIAEGKAGVQADHFSDINFSKDRALVSIRSPWNKQAQNDFRAFFMDTVSTNESEGIPNLEKRYIFAPWYTIDACVLPSDVVIATREDMGGYNPSQATKLCKTRPDVFQHKDSFCDRIKGFEYLIPYYTSKEQIFLENDSIPSKCNSIRLTDYTVFDKDFLFENSKKDSDNYLAVFQHIMNQYFYRDGLLLLSLAETASPHFALTNTSSAVLPTSDSISSFPGNVNSKVAKKHASIEKLITDQQNEPIVIPSRITQVKTSSGNENFVKEPLSEENTFIALPVTEGGLGATGLEGGNKEEEPRKGWQAKWYTSKNNATLFDKLNKLLPLLGSSSKEHQVMLDSLQQDIKQLLNWDQLESDNSFFSLVNTKSLDLNSLSSRDSGRAHEKEEMSGKPEIQDHHQEDVKFTGKNAFNSNSTKLGFKLLLCNSFRENSWSSMRYVSGYKFPDLNAFSVNSLFKQFIIPRVLISNLFAAGEFNSLGYLKRIIVKAKSSTEVDKGYTPTAFHSIESFGKASQLVNQVLLTPFRFKVPPALPTCYFKNLIESTHSFAKQKSKTPDFTIKPILKTKQEGKDIDKFELLYKGITLPELTQIIKVFEKVGIDYHDYLKQPKDSPFAILISPSLQDDDAIKLEAERKTEQGEKKMTPFQLLQDIRETEKQLEEAKNLRPFSAKNILAYQSVNGTSDFMGNNRFRLLPNKTTSFDTQTSLSPSSSFVGAKFSEFFKPSFFGEMSLLPKLLAAKDQKEIKEQLLDTNSVNNTDSYRYGKDNFLPLGLTTRLPNLRLRAEKDIIDLLDPANLEIRNVEGAQHRTFKADLNSSLKASAGDITKFSYSGGHKRKLVSNLFVAPSQHHVTLPQISGKDWKKILEWQLKTYFFDEQKRLESLRENNSDKQFKMKKLTIYLPWVTFRTSLNNAFEWPLTRLDFTEFVPASLSNSSLVLSKSSDSVASSKPSREYPSKSESVQQVDYMIAAKNMTLSQNYNWGDTANFKDSVAKTSLVQQINLPEKFYQNKKISQTSKREKLINKQYLFQGITNESYLLIYRLLLLFVLKSVFQYVYRISLKQFLIKMAYSDFGLTVTSPEFREWLQNSTPKAVYKVHKPLQSIAGIEHNISAISQIIWHLRNFGRTRHNIPAVLVLGPTAAEKTSLVQAIASEAKVAVVVQPLDGLLNNSISPYEKLEEVFLLARKQAPCILFLDSLDQIGKSRKNVVSNYAGAEDSLFCLDAEIAEGKHDFANLTHSLETGLLVNRSEASTSTFDRFGFHIRGGHSRGGGYTDDAFSDLSVVDQQDASPNKDMGSTPSLAFYQEKTEFESLRINLLLRLLTEIDGISPLQGVIVMATSNQSAILDPALLRPGRFQTIIKLSLPDKATRIQLLKIESQKLGSSHLIPWEYLATRTSNMSGADILSAVNHSAIRAILDNTVHTVQSLEHGLNCALGLPKSKNFALFTSKSCNDPFHTSRLAFYQAGKVVVQNLLLEYPSDAFFNLESTLLNIEQKQKGSRVNPLVATTRIHFQTKLVALYAGKAAELLQLTSTNASTKTVPSIDLFVNHLESHLKYTDRGDPKVKSSTSLMKPAAFEYLLRSKRSEGQQKLSNATEVKTQFYAKNWQSNLAFSDLLTASSVIHAMIDRWYLYSQRLFTLKTNQVFASLNYEQMQEQHQFVLFHKLSKQVYSERAKVGFWSNSKDQNNSADAAEHNSIDIGTGEFSVTKQIRQERQRISWWNEKICQEVEMFERPYGKWYRLYLPKVEQRERNEEWVPPDLIFHDFSPLSNLTKDHSTYLKTLHDLYLFERDSAYYNVVMNCFYKAFNLLSENRELVDFLADHFIRFKILRSPEMSTICSLYLR